MNKKGIIALVVVVVIIVIGFVVSGKKDGTSMTNTDTTSSTTPSTTTTVPAGVTKDTYKPVTKDTTDTTLLGRLNSSSVGISEDGKKIAFVNGSASFTSEGSSVKTTAKVGTIAIEKVDGSRKDVLATVALTTGNVTSTYLVLFLDNGSAGLADKSYALVGNGVTVTGIRADSVSDDNVDYLVSVSYTDSKKAAHSKLFVVAAGVIDPARTIEL